VNIEASREVVEACLDQLGICFCFAPLLHPSMKHVATVRKSLGVPTIFNLLGPLSNPAGAPFQLLGVAKAELNGVLAAALCQLGTRRALVVTGNDGLDEVTLAESTTVSRVENGKVTQQTWSPEEFGIDRAPLESLTVDSPAASARVIREVLDGHAGAARDIVVLNAAAALIAAGKTTQQRDAAELAANAIDSGNAKSLLEKLAARTQ